MKRDAPVNSQESSTSNVFIRLIQDGRIHDLDGLKRSYRKIVMKTHPDAVGSPRLMDQFVRFSGFYEEARSYLAVKVQRSVVAQTGRANPRLGFFQVMQRLESLDMPYAFNRRENETRIRALRAEAGTLFREWNPSYSELYTLANRQHQEIWAEKPSGPYLKHALALNVRPVIHNIISFHLTGRQFYRKQARQNIKAVLNKVQEDGYPDFRNFLSLLIQDMENGAAVFND